MTTSEIKKLVPEVLQAAGMAAYQKEGSATLEHLNLLTQEIATKVITRITSHRIAVRQQVNNHSRIQNIQCLHKEYFSESSGNKSLYFPERGVVYSAIPNHDYSFQSGIGFKLLMIWSHPLWGG